MTATPDRVFQAAVREHLLIEVAQQHAPTPLQSHPTGGRRPPRRDWTRIGIAVLVAAATIAGSWSVIRAAQTRVGVTPPAHSIAPFRPPSASATPAPDPVQEALGAVIGTGTFTGAVKGTFTITQDYGPTLHLRNFQIGTAKARQILVTVDLASASCKAQGVGTLAGTITSRPRQDIDLNDSSPQTLSDLSYMHALALWTDDGCSDPSSVIATTIHWTLPASIRDLAQHDSGPRPAARGGAQTRDGRPIRYTVASNDLIDDVAARFGLTQKDLLYLNPLRRHGNDVTLYAGEQLNLDPLNRDYFWR